VARTYILVVTKKKKEKVFLRDTVPLHTPEYSEHDTTKLGKGKI
jgi:hypothetical protein